MIISISVTSLRFLELDKLVTRANDLFPSDEEVGIRIRFYILVK